MRPESVAVEKNRVDVIENLYHLIAVEKKTLIEIAFEQHRYHESRRWSALELISKIDLKALTEKDRVEIWNAGKAELSAKPGADRLARQADEESREMAERNPTAALILQACGTWSRYWNEEESFHEIVFSRLSQLIGMPTIDDEYFVRSRQIFPKDDMLRTLTLLSMTEIAAMVGYASGAQKVSDPGLRNLYKQVSADEAQHMRHFVSFAKALVDSGAYHAKDAFAVVHFFLREGGEFQASSRNHVETRETHVNWWDQFDPGADQLVLLSNQNLKVKMACKALERITGIKVSSAEEVEDKWYELVGA